MLTDSLGDRMKMYEAAEAGRRFMPGLPILARIDGRAFHTFTRDMNRPFDSGLSECMLGTTQALVEETQALMGYTQSDEITLLWHSVDQNEQIWFDGRIMKMTSILGAIATQRFCELAALHLDEKYVKRRPMFDARVWNVPSRVEAYNTFVWREWDAVKNSISMAASHYYTPSELEGKSGSERQELLWQLGVNWNDYPTVFKRGQYVQRRKIVSRFTAEELERLPPKHAARTNPNLVVERSEVQRLELPPLTSIQNWEAVLFEAAEPIKKT